MAIKSLTDLEPVIIGGLLASISGFASIATIHS